tara:strand:+ start:40 stop:552 length:513 start_codon:yes stop_codon:yes gene_type:complete
MLGANFLLNLFKYKKNRNFEIIQYDLKKNFTLQDQIEIEIRDTDKKISENSKALVEAQLVKIRSTFSRSNNFIEKIGKDVYKKKLDDSINWHQQTIKDLYLRRRELEIKLEKIKGIFWFNQIKRFLRIILIISIIILMLIIFLSSFMFIISALPFIILIFIGYLISRKIH